MSVTIVILLSVIAAILLGVVITVTVEMARAHGRRMAGSLGAAGSIASLGSAQRLRSTLREEIGLTRRAVEQASAQDSSVSDLAQVVAELAGHAQQLDRLLADRPAVSAELRDRHHKLVTACRMIRSDLTDVEILRSSVALNDTLGRAQLEIETLRADRGFLADDPKIAELPKPSDRRDIE
jgi:ABC-type transporter Mla subunit MlaD